MNNKIKGNKFEEDFSDKLAENGYWSHLIAGANHTGSQPADIIACKDNKPYLIDCKTLENKSGNFSLTRLEENQRLCYKKYKKCGNKNYSIAILWKNNVYLIPLSMIDLESKSFNVTAFPIFWRNFYED